MHIRFTRDYQGRNSGEVFYPAGTIADLPLGAALVDEGAAEVYTVEARKGQVKQAEETVEDVPPVVSPLPFEPEQPKTRRGRQP